MTAAMLGAMALNCTFIVYVGVYLPQILHNRAEDHIVNLSPSMHLLLYAGYLFDLLYGFSQGLPWQYKTVSVVGLTLMLVQHLQLTRSLIKRRKQRLVYLYWLVLAGSMLAIVYFFTVIGGLLALKTSLALGYLSRLCFLLYTLPQIIKNNALKLANALSVSYLYLSLLLTVLDMIAAWCLHWGWPNKLGDPVSLLMLSILLWQMKHYQRMGRAAELSTS